jgi:hypothetical protein
MVRILPDGNDVMVLRLDESGPTRSNLGTLGSAGDWTDFGSPISDAQGLLGDAMYIPSAYLVNARNGSGGANDALITPNVSLSGWIFMRRGTNYPAEIFNKQYFLNAWSNPFLTFGFQTHTTSDGQCDLYITIGGVLQSVLRTPASYPIPIGRWSHIGGTWNGSTSKFYINGTLVTSANYSGTIDYGTVGNRGQWYVGGIPGSSANQDSPIIVQDVRIANIERPQSYFANIYYNGAFVNG